MKVKSIHIFFKGDDLLSARASIDVPGIGEITIDDCISEELRVRINMEAITALKTKMGQAV